MTSKRQEPSMGSFERNIRFATDPCPSVKAAAVVDTGGGKADDGEIDID